MSALPSRLRALAARTATASSLAVLLISAEACSRSSLEDLLGGDTFKSDTTGEGGASGSASNGGTNSGTGVSSTNGVGGFSSNSTDGVGGASVTNGVGGFSSSIGVTSSNGVGGASVTNGVSVSNGVGGFSSSNGVGGASVTNGVSSSNGVGGASVTNGVSSSNGVGGFSSSNGVGGFSSSDGVGGFSSSDGVGGFSSSDGVGGASVTSVSSSNGVGGGSVVSVSSVAASTNASSSSTGGLLEDCTNGKDDNFNGLIDCADPECFAGFTCAEPAPPGGWIGPVAIWEGSNEPPPSCDESGGFPNDLTDGMEGPSAGAETCPSCACSAPKGVGCQVATEGFYNNGTCSAAPGNLTIAEGVCQAFVTLSYDPASTRWQSAPAAGGACIPIAAGNPIIPPVEWAGVARACGDSAEGGGCGPSACVPKPSGPFNAELCVYQVGDIVCPAGPYSVKHLYYESADDTRMCSGCDCGDPTGTGCVGTMKLYSDQFCSADETILSNVSQCSPLAPDPTPPPPPYESLRSVLYTGEPSGAGSCVSVPSTPSGTVTAADPITICCAP